MDKFIQELDKILANEPKYRLKQAKEAVFKNLAENWSGVLNFPSQLREKLNKECPLEIKGEIIQSSEGKGASKAIIILDDGLKIESVLMSHNDGRNTICVSSQAGCPMGCKFCATGAAGFKRNLTVWEIVGQVLFFARFLKKKKERVSNVVFMGMGEPFLNYDNVISAIKILNDKEGLNIGARKISISTSGIIEGIEKLAKEKIQANLAISLHAPDDGLRSELMPVNKKYPLAKVLRAVDFYIKRNHRQVMFEYVLLKGINDSKEQAEKLGKLMRKPLYFVNLIAYNPSGIKGMRPPSSQDIKEFKEILEKAGAQVSQRYRFGREIKAACGQLASK